MRCEAKPPNIGRGNKIIHSHFFNPPNIGQHFGDPRPNLVELTNFILNWFNMLSLVSYTKNNEPKSKLNLKYL